MTTRTRYTTPRVQSPVKAVKSSWILENRSAATTTPTRNSNNDTTSLASLARFQQKQLQEKEQRLLQLYDQQQQRAHQVAQRGITGSLDDVNAPTTKTRQLFAEKTRHRSRGGVGKGIDKSYPLEPLGGGRRNGALQPAGGVKPGFKTARPDGPADSRRQEVRENENNQQQHRVSSGASVYLAGDGNSSVVRSGKEYAKGNGGASIGNGHHRYEINIDEVIDDDAMERNRMVARYSSSIDSETRRQYSYEDTVHRSGNGVLSDVSNANVGQRGKKPSAPAKQPIPSDRKQNDESVAQSSFTKTTESSSQSPRRGDEKIFFEGASTALHRERTKSPLPENKIYEPVRQPSPPSWDERATDPGQGVRAVVMKIESTASEILIGRSVIERRRATTDEGATRSIRLSQESSSTDDGYRRATLASTTDSAAPVRSQVPGEQPPKDRHFVSLADLKIQGRSLSESPKRTFFPLDELTLARRASFESKLRLFEPLSPRESADRQTRERSKSVESSVATRSPSPSGSTRARKVSQGEASPESCARTDRIPGFQRSTCSSLAKISSPARGQAPTAKATVKTVIAAPKCLKKRPMLAKTGSSYRSGLGAPVRGKSNDDGDVAAKKSSLLRDPGARFKSVHHKSHDEFSCSAKKRGDPVSRRGVQANARTLEGSIKKSFSLYTPLRNADNSSEQQNQQPSSRNSSSLKFLNKIAEQQTDERPTPAPRKSSLPGTPDSTLTLEKPVTPAVRTSFSGSSAVATNRTLNSNGLRTTTTTAQVHDNVKSKNTTSSSPSPADDQLTMCKTCKRNFNSERITLHEKICAKMAQKSRKQFDATTQRVRGTEFEAFVVTKPVKKKQSKKAEVKASAPASAASSSKSNWRRKHEDFINTIRSAKQMQVHLAAGGKLSDLPPPPPSDTSDYVQCPHCSRKFGPGAAERHVPMCEAMQRNKGPVRPGRPAVQPAKAVKIKR
ncbi:flocculation protein FLO11-like [Copidosoma floridanum]|uniref:flocculation protein FLO11-like n=1 Tax=Copidosoma floridanum TaxID=29053 RepID=UPI0006C98806|nr:flocculation protein FLO11-like [Copidosoma floridanum]